LKKYSKEELMNTNGSQLLDFKEILSKKMQFYDSNPVTTTKGEIISNLNLETLMERDNKINIMVQKSENLIDFSNNDK